VLLQDGVKKGYTPPKLNAGDVPKQIARSHSYRSHGKPAIGGRSRSSPRDFPKRSESGSAIAPGKFTRGPSLRHFRSCHDYVASTYLPACRESIAATALPNGAAAYAFHVRWQTTTKLTPPQIHEIGLAEVKRIRAQMDRVIALAGFKGSFHDFTEFLRTDPRFYYDKPDDLVTATASSRRRSIRARPSVWQAAATSLWCVRDSGI